MATGLDDRAAPGARARHPRGARGGYGNGAGDGQTARRTDGDGDLEYLSDDEEDVNHLRDLASEAPVIRLVNLLINRAVEQRASDIHIEPFENELKVRYRIDGVLHDVETPPRRLQAAIVSRIKIMAKLNIAERRLPQDGRIKLRTHGQGDRSPRLDAADALRRERRAAYPRPLEHRREPRARSASPATRSRSSSTLIHRPYGMILVTGPTGSGKTTTLYGALDKINSPDKKIITIEDPVEYQLFGVNQIHVKPPIGLTFANGLRSIVRQDPDVIMVGEIRDAETAEIAIQAALTGHLVFSTLHTNDAAGAVSPPARDGRRGLPARVVAARRAGAAAGAPRRAQVRAPGRARHRGAARDRAAAAASDGARRRGRRLRGVRAARATAAARASTSSCR